MSEAITQGQYREMERDVIPAPISLKGRQQAVEHVPNLSGTVGEAVNWQDFAACKGLPGVTRYFYPPSGQYERKEDKLERERRAKEVCGSCAVRQVCLEVAIRTREKHGVWGGLNEKERGRLISRRSSN